MDIPVARMRFPSFGQLSRLRYGLLALISTRGRHRPDALETQSAREWITRWGSEVCVKRDGRSASRGSRRRGFFTLSNKSSWTASHQCPNAAGRRLSRYHNLDDVVLRQLPDRAFSHI